MKKCLKLVCSLFMIFVLGLVMNVQATYKGATETFNVSVESTSNINAGGIEFTYDTSALEIQSGEWKGNFANAAIKDFNVGTGQGVYLFMSPVTISGEAFTVTFKIKDTAAVGSYTINIKFIVTDATTGVKEYKYSTHTITVECNHSFTKQDTSDTYLASAADCQNKAKYYYSCVDCGTKGTETFESGSALGHTGGTATCTEKAVCTRCNEAYGEILGHTGGAATCTEKAVCTRCNEAYGEVLGHTGGTATCTKKAVCTRCNSEYGELKAHDFTKKDTDSKYLASEANCTDADKYYYSCTACGEKGTTTFENGAALGHTGGTATCTKKAVCTRCNSEYGSTLPHTYDKEVAESKYIKTFANCQKAATYYKSCVCGAKGTETFTSGSLGSHDYSSKWYSDKDSHWHECMYCTSTSGNAKHNPGAEATETTPQTCKDCGYVIKAALGHTHKYETKYSHDETDHWYECSCGDKKDSAKHTFDNECDPTCDTCGYTRDVAHDHSGNWQNDASGHWHTCSKCGEKSEVETHVPGAAATETTDQTCTVCGYVIEKALGHTHAYTEKHDENNHWEECTCGEKQNVETHKYDEGVVTKEPTVDAEGEKKYTCECGYEKLETLPKLEDNKEKGCKKDLSALVVGVISLAVVGVLLKKKEN
ncbi:MAG: hypothetical protein IJX78_03045 [Bacilli bacterium]|nr:hypothetical protein [Bacilli bacterium]